MPVRLVTALLFEKLKRRQESPTSASVSGAQSPAGGCRAKPRVQGGRWEAPCDGADPSEDSAPSTPEEGEGPSWRGQRTRAGPDPSPAAKPPRPTQGLLCARGLGPLWGAARYPGGVSRGPLPKPVKTFTFLLKSEF